MVEKVLGTLFSRIITTALLLIVVVINANAFGAGGTGTIALVLLGLTLLQVLTNFVGGGTLIYLVPRKNNFQLFILSFVWATVTNLVGLYLLVRFNLVPPEYKWWLLVMTSCFSLYNINSSIIQGKENIRFFNILQLVQSTLLVVTLLVLLLIFRLNHLVVSIELYLLAYIISYLVVMVVSMVYVAKQFDDFSLAGSAKLLKEMLKLGVWTQLANLAQLLTYRLNYYLINLFIGRKELGVFELGTKISEAIWIFPKSICLVQYASIANSKDVAYTQRLTIGLLKVVFVFAMVAVVALALLPKSFIAFIFGDDFYNSKMVIYSLMPGIVFLSCVSILAHYFSGYGKYWVNAMGSVISLVVTAVAGIIFIPHVVETAGKLAALQAAGWITSLAHLANLIWVFSLFIYHTRTPLKAFCITRSDCAVFKQVVMEKLSTLKRRDRS